jgi:hypothetical protein
MPRRDPRTSWQDRLPHGLSPDFDYSVIRTAAHVTTLLAALPNRDRGTAAKNLYKRRKILGNKVAYSGMIQAWDHDDFEVKSAFGGEAEFVQALREVARPSQRKRPVRAWRGVRNLDGAYGVSWTTERDIACWFSMLYYERHQTPFVFFCDLRPDDIVVEHSGRKEYELLVDPRSLYGRAMLAVCDGDTSIEACEMTGHSEVPPSAIADWRLSSDRVVNGRDAERINRLKALRKRAEGKP